MKKLTLFLVAMLFSALSFAALNPYAYGLSSSLDGTTLKVNYSLNAPATAVSVVIMDGETEVHTVACDGKTKGSHSVEISTLDLPTGKSLTWKVNVTGAAVAKATAVKTYRFFHPSGIDVDNNPESSNFGRILCLEANHSVKTTTSTNGYLGKGYGAGIYAFDAAFDKITNGSYPGFNGGNTFTTTHYAVRRIRISDDGRIFVTAQNNGGCFLWEVDPDNLNNWTKVFNGTASTYTTTTADGKFMAGTNSGFDVHGSGENLKLVMLSASKSGANVSTFRCDEYDLGTKTEWSTVPSRTIPGANYHIVTSQSNIQYDKDGGVWHIQYRGTCDDANPGLVYINKDGVEDYKLLRHNTRNAGFCFNKDFTKVIIAGKFQNGTGTQKYATIYAVSKDADGKPVLTEEQVVDMTNIGYALNDFAWDWADNIYAVDNNGEYLCAYALPHTADKVVSTPCASKYAFEVEEIVANVYTLTTNVVGEGTIEGNEGSYVEGTTATLTATPAEHYDFLNWTYGSETSTDNPLTITVNSDMTVTANFQEHTKYTITANAADNTMGYVTGGKAYYAGETVTLKAVANSTYYFVNWSDGNTDAIRTFTATADVTLTANFAKATPRAWAYDLKVVEDGDNYKFTFNATTAGTATLLFADKEGNALVPTSYDLGAINAGLNTATVAKSLFTEPKDIYWSVKMDGEAITAVAEITDQSRNIYDFYNMQGVVVDNDPNSEKFGEIYIEMAKSGTTNSKAQTLGLFLLNQNLDVLNTNPNVGIQPTMPDGYALNGTNYTFQRLNIHPKTGDLVFSYGISSKPAVFAIDRENMTGSVTNLLDGITGLTKTVAHCFDAEGTLYVMDLPGSGTIYKIKDGAKSTFAAADSKYAASNITMASDGRGGLWVAQNRGQIDSYYQLVHYNNGGTVDYSVYDDHKTYNSTNGTLGVSSTGLTGYSTRGALAYDVERQILAQGRNNAVEVFSVAYDATTGAPSLTKIATTPIATAANIDGIAFDYAGDLYVVNSGNEKFNKYTLPTAENICTVPAPESQAIIKEVRYTVTVNTVGNGTATGAGEYVAGETATLEASPAANHNFVNWTYGSETSTDNPLSLVVNSDITVTANFEPVQYTLIAPTNDENKGTVTGAGTYNYGTEVTLTANPTTGYKLLYWSDRSTENPRTITMTKNEAISAYFVKEYTEEPTFTITKVWENLDAPASTNNGYQAVGWDGKIYLKDRGNDVINVYSDATTSATYASTDSKDDQSIAVDDAGNLVLRSGSTNFYDAPKQVILYKKGETTYKTIDFTLPAPERCDFISASGDLFSTKGGYIYFYCKNTTCVNRLKITNGTTTAIDVVGNLTAIENTQSHVMVDIFGNLVTHARTTAINKTINIYTSEATTFTLPNDQKAIALGGCSFELGGKEFWAYNVKGSNICNTEWNLYNMTDKKYLSNEPLYVENKTDKNSAANWLNVQVVDENTAYIYQFCPTVAMAVWKVSIQRDDLQEYTVTATANDASMGSVTGGGTYYENATATLTATANAGYRFVNWTKAGLEVSTDATYTFTVTEDVELVANFEEIPAPRAITYELNGGQYNQYGWENKGDICLDLETDYNATYGTSKDWVQKVDGVILYNINGTWMTEEEAKRQESTVAGFLQASTYNTTDNLKKLIETTMVDKYGWLKDVIVANREEQSVAGELSEAIYRKELSAFFLHSPAHSNWPASSSYEEAGELITYQAYWDQSFPNPTCPESAVVLNAPYKEGYLFDGWYETSDFSGAEITVVDETTNGTLYAKWLEHFYTRDVTNGRYGTICLPYGSSNMTGAIFYKIAWINKSTMRVFMDEVTELEAGKPYIFLPTSSQIKVVYQGEKADEAGDNNGLYGTFTDMADGPAGTVGNKLEGNYMLSNNQIIKCLGNCKLPANRAYFKLDKISTIEPAPVPGRRRVALDVQGGNEATGVDNLTEDGVVPAMEGTYDVLGRKMNEPKNTGFYIVNGKKVVIVK